MQLVVTGSRWAALTFTAAVLLSLAGAAVPGAPVQARDAGPEAASQLAEETLIARGNALLETGDFASARLLYQAAASQGSAKAAMLTGVTFDPRYQAMIGVSGTASNARLARQWYALATERGDEQASRNDDALVQWLKEQNLDPEAAGPAGGDAAVSPDTTEPAPVADPDAKPAAKPSGATAEPDLETASRSVPADAPASRDQAAPAPREAPEPQPAEIAPEPEPDPEPVALAAPAPAREADARPSDGPAAVDTPIVRAQLTSAVKDREPVDLLPSPIRVSGGGVDRITFFSEVRGLAGQRVSHRWEHEGRTMADIALSVGADTWRMHSSKRVTPAMTGNWRVVVVDGGGAELASVPFVLE